MSKTASLTAFANKEAAKLGLTTPLRVMYAHELRPDGKRCQLRRALAHAHCYERDVDFGRVCIRRNGWTIREWHETIRHEVAHFTPGGKSHGVGFLRTRAKQGSRSAKAALIMQGKERCTRHDWVRMGELERKADARGLTIRYRQKCRLCGSERPKRVD